MTVFALALLVWLMAAGVYRWLSFRALDALAEQCAAPAKPGTPLERIVALRPLCGAHDYLAGCLESLAEATRHGKVRVVLGLEDPEDPARPEAESACRSAPWRAELRIGLGPPGINRKVANLIQMSTGAAADVFVLSDADIRVPEDYIARATDRLRDPAVGLVTFPYRSVPAATVSSRIDALATNLHFLPGVAQALVMQGLHFGLGASLAVRADALAGAGGLDGLLDVAGDDYWLAQRVEAAGYRLELEPMMLEHVLEQEGWRRIFARHVRWARVIREERPLGYIGQTVTHGGLPAMLLGVFGIPWLGALAPLVPLAWYAVQLRAFWRRRSLLGLESGDLKLIPLADGLAFVAHVSGLVGRAYPSSGALHPSRATTPVADRSAA